MYRESNPQVSICIPTYNSEKYIEQMLMSIVAQTYKNIEVIISDNCSTDKTLEILERYSSRYNWKISQNKTNIGALANMSKLINLANGKYTAMYHADDLYEPNIIEKSVKVLENEVSISMVSTLGYSINHEDKVLYEFRLPKRFEKQQSLNFDLVFSEILSQRHFFLITPSVMTRSVYYKESSLFHDRYKSSADYGKWFEILQKGDLHIIDEKLIRYRTHDLQGSHSEIKTNFKIPDSVVLYEDFAKKRSDKHWNSFLYSYSKLMLIQAIKLNNSGNFKRSQIFLRMILRRTKKNNVIFVLGLMICNVFSVRFSLDRILGLKKILVK